MLRNTRKLALCLVCCWLLPVTVANARQSPAAIVVDANTGRTLHAADADAPRFPASLTKMMTIFIIFEDLKSGRLKPSTQIRFSDNAAARPPSKLGLKAGETISVENAIRALVVKSANDVATAVAEHISGSERAFARRMTARARALGMTNTTFANASGLPDSRQLTTARDMARLGLALQDHFPHRYRMFRRNRFAYRGRVYRNHNRLLGRFAGTDGIKTGYTRASGFNIATSVRRDGRHVIGVVIGRKSGRIRDTQMRRLLAKYLPRASTVRTRRSLTPPLLVARPQMVPRRRAPAYRHARTVAHSNAPATVGGETLIRSRMIASRPAVPSPAVRQPSTFGDQLARMRALRSQPPRRLPSSATAVSGQSLPRAATHQVQIGAYSSEADARRALEIVKTKARGLLRGYQPVSLRHQIASRAVFRARFAGFDARQATETCSRLRSVRVDCFVTRSN